MTHVTMGSEERPPHSMYIELLSATFRRYERPWLVYWMGIDCRTSIQWPNLYKANSDNI